MADSRNKNISAQTILHLRPQKDEAIAVLDLDENKLYRLEVAPPPEPTDIPLDGISEVPGISYLSSHETGHDSVSRETTPGLYATCPRVFRLGFDSLETPSIRGFTFGSGPDSAVKLPYYSKKRHDKNRNYFRIHYNFKSGALMITAIDTIRIGSAVLSKHESLLLMANTSIHCGGVFEFAVEFPDLSKCAEEHERNYQEYAAKFGITDAQYLPTPGYEYPPIGAEHRSLAVLGRGAFGEVHKALNTKDGELYAIKILSEGEEQAIKEVNIMSKFRHVSLFVFSAMYLILTMEKENIIRYEHAFKLASSQICIVMELAVNDLRTHLKARPKIKRTSYLYLPFIRSIGRQALSGLEYLHNRSVTHRDLKPENILVTEWDVQTDIPTIKLADFGLAGVRSENSMHTTFCGTEGYAAPEVLRGYERLKELEKQRDKGMKTIPQSRVLSYDKSVDIWALGKILHDLLGDILSDNTSKKNASASKAPALRLIRRMMQEDPKNRPTAAQCLEDPWMRTDNSSNLPAQKRNRSPTPSTEQPLKRVVRRALGDLLNTDELASIMNPILADDSKYKGGFSARLRGPLHPSNTEIKDHVVIGKDRELSQPLLFGEGHRMSLTAYRHDNVEIPGLLITRELPIQVGSTGPQAESPSLQAVARKLLEALQAEGYGNAVTVGGELTGMKAVSDKLPKLNISKIQLRQETDDSILLEVEPYFDREELACGSWNKQCLQNNSNDPKPIFNPQLLDQTEPINYTEQLFLPTITPNDNQARHTFTVCFPFRNGNSKGFVLDRTTSA